MTTAIWWIRRDIRIHDQQALTGALGAADSVLPVFIKDPALAASPYTGERRWRFLLAGLHALDHELRQRGSRLLYFEGSPLAVLSRLIKAGFADHIFAEEDVTPFARQRDSLIEASLPVTFTGGLSLMPLQSVTTKNGGAYHVYTPFRNALIAHPLLQGALPLPTPARIPLPMDKALPESEALPAVDANSAAHFPAGEQPALARLQSFSEGTDATIFRYAEGRNGLHQPGSAHLSPYFRFGMLSIRTAYQQAERAMNHAVEKDARKSVRTWRNQLIWREFFINILDRHPYARTQSFRPEYRSLAWINNPDDFEAWKAGRTGYPVVDAAMRQLHQEGWIPNRARLIVASFLVKHLLIDWRWGEKWFMQQLLDGDPAQNNGGWQWSAGTGTDAAPYFRIFNPILQSKRYDPEGNYLRSYVPELDALDADRIHEPWKLSEGERNGYPQPIVEHGFARERALATFSKARQRA